MIPLLEIIVPVVLVAIILMLLSKNAKLRKHLRINNINLKVSKENNNFLENQNLKLQDKLKEKAKEYEALRDLSDVKNSHIKRLEHSVAIYHSVIKEIESNRLYCDVNQKVYKLFEMTSTGPKVKVKANNKRVNTPGQLVVKLPDGVKLLLTTSDIAQHIIINEPRSNKHV